jgi:hypothetical protein
VILFNNVYNISYDTLYIYIVYHNVADLVRGALHKGESLRMPRVILSLQFSFSLSFSLTLILSPSHSHILSLLFPIFRSLARSPHLFILSFLSHFLASLHPFPPPLICSLRMGRRGDLVRRARRASSYSARRDAGYRSHPATVPARLGHVRHFRRGGCAPGLAVWGGVGWGVGGWMGGVGEGG